jgi:hypothetical protein
VQAGLTRQLGLREEPIQTKTSKVLREGHVDSTDHNAARGRRRANRMLLEV